MKEHPAGIAIQSTWPRPPVSNVTPATLPATGEEVEVIKMESIFAWNVLISNGRLK
jgi:hypothetical protein